MGIDRSATGKFGQGLSLIALVLGSVAFGAWAFGEGPSAPGAIREVHTLLTDQRGGEPVVVRARSGVSLQDIRSVVRDEVASALEEAQAGVATPEQEAEQMERAAASAAASDEARVLIDAALSAGAWTEHDRAAMRMHVSQMSAEDQEGVFRRLFTALNRGAMSYTLSGPAI